MAFDYKKEYEEFYLPEDKPSIMTVPAMNYIAIRGQGDLNTENSECKAFIGLLYRIALTIEMSKRGDHQINGYFDRVVPPLEGFWWQEKVNDIDYAHKENFNLISVIRLPDFVAKADFEQAIGGAMGKKRTDFSKVEFLTYDGRWCVQCIYIGSYNNEPKTVTLIHQFMGNRGCILDITDERMHRGIYLSDAKKAAPEKSKTVIRHSIRGAWYEQIQPALKVGIRKWYRRFQTDLF